MGYSDIIGTVTEEDNNVEEDEMEIALSEMQTSHGARQFVRYPDSDSEEEM